MAVIRDLSRLSSWSFNENANCTEVDGSSCPWFASSLPAIRNTLVDGQRPSWDPSSNERSDLQSGTAPASGYSMPVVFGIEFAIRVLQAPSPPYGSAGWRWWLVGPEIHNNGSTGQALMMFEIDEQRRWRVNMNAGSSSAFYVRTPDGSAEWRKNVTIGQWEYFRMFWNPHTTGNTTFELYDQGTLVARKTGAPTANSQGPGYWKCANYSTASLNGTRQYEIKGFQVHNELPPNRSGTQPPPQSDVAAPTFTWRTPTDLSSLHTTLSFDFDVADASEVTTVWMGIGGNPVPPITLTGTDLRGTRTGNLDVSGLSGTYFPYIAAQDVHGNQGGLSRQVTITVPPGGAPDQVLRGEVTGASVLTGRLSQTPQPTITEVVGLSVNQRVVGVPRYFLSANGEPTEVEVEWNSSTQAWDMKE